MARYFEVCKNYNKDEVTLPKRSTKKAAGYDFYANEDIEIPSIWKRVPKAQSFIAFACEADENGKKKKPFQRVIEYVKEQVQPTIVKTGVKVYLEDDEVLELYNRSSGARKNMIILANGVGIVDADYVDNEDNDGEIGFMFWNLSPLNFTVKKGDKIGQGIIKKFLLVDNDNVEDSLVRSGGYGSTGK